MLYKSECVSACVFSHHDGYVVAVLQRQRAVHVEDVVLRVQEALQVLWVGGHVLRH